MRKEPEPIDAGTLATQLKNDANVLKAKEEIVNVREAADKYNDAVRRVLRGECTWADGGRNVRSEMPSELTTRMKKGTLALEKAEADAFGRQRKLLDATLEARRRDVEGAWQDLTTKMARLHADELVVRSLKPRRVAYRADTADVDLASSAPLDHWRRKTWAPKPEDRPKLPRIDLRRLVGQLVG